MQVIAARGGRAAVLPEQLIEDADDVAGGHTATHPDLSPWRVNSSATVRRYAICIIKRIPLADMPVAPSVPLADLLRRLQLRHTGFGVPLVGNPRSTKFDLYKLLSVARNSLRAD